MIRINILSNIILFSFLLLATNVLCLNLLKKNLLKRDHKVQITVKVLDKNPVNKSTKKLSPYSHLFVVLTEKCTISKCSSPKGYCLSENVCKCAKGYANASKFSSNKSQFCQYEQKKQYYALLLELIFFFGIGHFYSHRIIMFFVKASFFILILFIRSIYQSFKNEKKSVLKLISQISYYTLLSIYILYHSLDLMMFYLNKYTDGYGIPLTKY